MTTNLKATDQRPSPEELVLWLAGEADVGLNARVEKALEQEPECLEQVLALSESFVASAVAYQLCDAQPKDNVVSLPSSAAVHSSSYRSLRLMLSVCAAVGLIAGVWYLLPQPSNDELAAWVVCLDNANSEASRVSDAVMLEEAFTAELPGDAKSEEAFSWIMLAVNESTAPQVSTIPQIKEP